MVFLVGIAASPIMISASTIVHESVDDRMRGRIFSSLGIVMNLGLLIFMLAGSILAEIVGNVPILLTCGLVFVGFGLAGLLLDYRKAG
jgi:MFS family permease